MRGAIMLRTGETRAKAPVSMRPGHHGRRPTRLTAAATREVLSVAGAICAPRRRHAGGDASDAPANAASITTPMM